MKRQRQRPERFMVVAFTEHQESQVSLPAWPQHMTIVPWMLGPRLQTTNRIVDAVADFTPLRIVIDGEDQFGVHGETRAWTLKTDEDLHEFHQAVLGAASKYGTELEDAQFVGDNYNPHITKKPGQPRREIGDSLLLPEISIIGRHELLGKIVLRNIPLIENEAAA